MPQTQRNILSAVMMWLKLWCDASLLHYKRFVRAHKASIEDCDDYFLYFTLLSWNPFLPNIFCWCQPQESRPAGLMCDSWRRGRQRGKVRPRNCFGHGLSRTRQSATSSGCWRIWDTKGRWASFSPQVDLRFVCIASKHQKQMFWVQNRLVNTHNDFHFTRCLLYDGGILGL